MLPLAAQDLVGGGLLELTLGTDRPCTPRDLGVGDDTRLIGPGLREILLEEAGAS